MKPLLRNDVILICNEIEKQWEYHLMARAVFDSSFPKNSKYESPSFYKTRGFHFKIEIPDKTQKFDRAADGIALWLNQNYVIRLFGILDSKEIIKTGIESKSEVIELVKLLRNNTGAHSTGRRVSKKKEHRRATDLINRLFDRRIDLSDQRYYTLSIDTVLEPLKNKIITFVENLESKDLI